MRLIDADELKDTLKKLVCNHCPTTGVCASCSLGKFLYVVESAPAIDATPVRRGEWHVCQDVDGNEYGKCSYCGGEIYDGDNDTFDQPPDFCPHCGADMRVDRR